MSAPREHPAARQLSRPDETRDRPRRRGWSVRRYMVLSMVVLLAVAAASGVTVRTIGQ